MQNKIALKSLYITINTTAKKDSASGNEHCLFRY